jgi:hypothetical protein
VQTPVVTVGRFTIDRIDPQGSLGAVGVAGTEGEGELKGDGDACPKALPVRTVSAQTKKTAPTSRVQTITRQL